jgi:hypothetical protein
MLSRRAAVVFAIGDLITAGVLTLGVFVGLPSRWAVVDLPAVVVVALHVASGAGLLAGKSWAPQTARLASAVSLVLGLSLITVLALTASWLSGVYGPVGLGGALVLVLVAALALPYLVALPVVRLAWMRGVRGQA